MNCAEFWNQMPELVSGDNPEQDHDHVRQCPQCASLLERQRRLMSGLRTMAGDMRAVGAPPRVENVRASVPLRYSNEPMSISLVEASEKLMAPAIE